MTPQFDLVIFDCDGVLVDSEIVSCRTYAEHLTRQGYPITPEQIAERFLGRALRDTKVEVENEIGRALPDDFSARLSEETHRAFVATLEAMPHISAALDAIAQPVCVASSGSPDKIRTSLELVGLYDRLAPHLFSATQVRHGKPAPDLFLHAAAQMNAQPSRCLVIEDSVAGVTGARKAGMTVFGFLGGGHCQPGTAAALREAGAAASFDDFRQLTEMMK